MTDTAHDFALAQAERLAIVRDVLAANPTCAVGIVDANRRVGAAGGTLAGMGIELGPQSTLDEGALVEFVAVSDVWLLSEVGQETGARGASMRTLRLRDGQIADLHLVVLDDSTLTKVAIIVPGAGGTIAQRPPPTAISASPRVGVIECDTFAVITSATQSTSVLLGHPDTSIVGLPVVTLIHPDDQEMAIVNWLAAKEQPGAALRWRCRLNRADGSALWTEVTITNEVDGDGDGSFDVELCDVSAEVAATEALVAERELIAQLTETLPVGVAKFDARGRVEHANQRLGELLAPLDPHDLLDQAAQGELEDLDLAVAFSALFHDGTSSSLVVDHVASNGTTRHLEWTIRAATAPTGTVNGGIVCIADVTETAQLHEALERRAVTDGLTGCLNRAGTIAAVERALSNLVRSEGVGLLFVDLDNFKGINDSHGHTLGDDVLKVVANRLRAGLRSGDLIGRLGGDEFVIIAPGLHSASATLVFAERVFRHLHGETQINDVPVAIGGSIGVAWTSTGSATELLAAADAAMYVAKQQRASHPVLSPSHR